MFSITLYKVEDLFREEVKNVIFSALDYLWITDSFSLLIEVFFNRDDYIRSVRIFHLNSGYRLEMVFYKDEKGNNVTKHIIKDNLTKEMVAFFLNKFLGGTSLEEALEDSVYM